LVIAMTNRLLWAVAVAAIGSSVLFADRASAAERAQAATAGTAVYANENGTDPDPLKLRSLQGSVEGLGGEAMPGAQVALFTEDGHSLVATATSDRKGKFHFGKVAKGLYRVVARVEGLCPANVPIKLESSLLAHRKLIITMRPKDIGTCSYGMAK
jgi:hypothetical protein